jgi:hypothetical protein
MTQTLHNAKIKMYQVSQGPTVKYTAIKYKPIKLYKICFNHFIP